MMKRIFLILTLTTLIFACKKEDSQPNNNYPDYTPIMGCMDSTMFNYNPLANTEYTPSNCVPYIYGCTDSTALNYNTSANIDDGSCENAGVSGCMDSLAINYNTNATVDDGTCIPYVLKLSSITINAMPMTHNNGETWDWDITGLTSDPDVFYVLKQGGAELALSSSQDNISTFPILFTEDLPYTIQGDPFNQYYNLSQEYAIELYDNDQIAGIGENELIGSCSFTPNDHIPTGGLLIYPTEINIQSAGIDMTLAIEWLP